MRIRPPHIPESGTNRDWLAPLDEALAGRQHDREARAWQELHEDVRALAPPLDPELERRIHERIAERERSRRRLILPPAIARWMHPRVLLAPAAGLAVTLALIVGVVLVSGSNDGRSTAFTNDLRRGAAKAPASEPKVDFGPANAHTYHRAQASKRAIEPEYEGPAEHTAAPPAPENAPAASAGAHGAAGAQSAAGAQGATGAIGSTGTVGPQGPQGPANTPERAGTNAGPMVLSPSEGAAGYEDETAPAPHTALLHRPAPARKQEVAASITLGPEPQAVQSTSDKAGQIAVRDGGYVERSNVVQQKVGANEATLVLEIPTSKIGLALAALARLAPVDAENQYLQDITGQYEAATRRLAEAKAEHQGLLRALAAAETEEEIERLHGRLAHVSDRISRDEAALHGVNQRADTAEVEVTVTGHVKSKTKVARHHQEASGLTLNRGLHDAGDVLTVAFVVLLIAAAVLLPLALALLAVLGAWRAWRRYQREQALEGS